MKRSKAGFQSTSSGDSIIFPPHTHRTAVAYLPSIFALVTLVVIVIAQVIKQSRKYAWFTRVKGSIMAKMKQSDKEEAKKIKPGEVTTQVVIVHASSLDNVLREPLLDVTVL